MKKLLVTLCTFAGLICMAAPARAQIGPTFVVSDTVGRFTFTPSSDHAGTFGTPPIAVLSSYVVDLFLKAAITDFVACTSTPAAPVASIDIGKPTPVANVITTAPIKSLFTLTPNLEYFACVRSLGPNGSSARSAVDVDATGAASPFGFPSSPAKPTGVRTGP